jgi:hypothetical protein
MKTQIHLKVLSPRFSARAFNASAFVVFSLSVAFYSAPANAEKLAGFNEMNNRSTINGFNRDSIPLLKRAKGPGAAKTARELHARFSGQSPNALIGPIETVETDKGVRIKGSLANWTIHVKGDGSSARLEKYEYLKSAPRVPRSQRLTSVELEQLGRKFVGTDLRDFVVLDPSDELVALKTKYQVEAVGEGERTITEEVAANFIVFGRRHNGVDIVGAGSKIMVAFANDRTPVAFSYDWPRYIDQGKSQRVHEISTIRERVAALSTMRLPASTVSVRRFECGSFDPGVRLSRRDDNAQIQAACMVHYVGSKPSSDAVSGSATTEESISDPIPAGIVVEEDLAWPHAIAVRKHGDVCRSSVLNATSTPRPGPAL